MDRNTLLAIVLSTGFLLVWFGVGIPWFQSWHPTRPQTPSTPSSSPPMPTGASAAPTAEATSAAVAPSSALRPPGPPVVLETSQCRVELVASGAAVTHWFLKERGGQVDLVHLPSTLTAGSLLGTWPELTFQLKEHTAQRAVWVTELSNHVRVTKIYEINPAGHLHRLRLLLSNPSLVPVTVEDVRLSVGPGLGTVTNEEKENPGLIRALSFDNHQLQVYKPGEYPLALHPPVALRPPGPVQWVGLDNRYFLAALIVPSLAASQTSDSSTLLVEGSKAETTVHITERCRLAPGETQALEWQLYLGPKGYTQLRRLGLRLEESVDFGWMGALGKAALHALYFLHRLTGNYGWAIVLLTIGLQILLFPLAMKSLKASLAMKALQPQVKALQERFKGDPKRLNVEMMHLYKQSGTNPLGGCLPMLLQLPIFWALFTTLRNAYELRGAPFIGWIRDLSAQDPYYALPIFMGLGMFVQQRMTAVAADPTQRQMMYIMPVIFTFMFLRFPAGLVLYWLVNNLLTIAEQWGFQRWNQPR
ncbi:MAG: membrane protein insertase YidC [Elusimicrobia bacterium]|nr:membrane protein insertase YidC [Elusimicrobiota bacterium]